MIYCTVVQSKDAVNGNETLPRWVRRRRLVGAALGIDMLVTFLACYCFSAKDVKTTLKKTVEIAPGVEMPLVGIGTWQYNSSTAQSEVSQAMAIGYRHIDTALGYGNQDGVGAAIKAAIDDLGITRDEVFLVSKIPGGLNSSATSDALKLSLSQLFPGDPSAYVDVRGIEHSLTFEHPTAR